MRKHPIDLFALLSGLIVIGFAVAFIVGAYTDLTIDARLIGPILLVGFGAAGLAGALVAQRRSDARVDSAGSE